MRSSSESSARGVPGSGRGRLRIRSEVTGLWPASSRRVLLAAEAELGEAGVGVDLERAADVDRVARRRRAARR